MYWTAFARLSVLVASVSVLAGLVWVVVGENDLGIALVLGGVLLAILVVFLGYLAPRD